MSAAACDDEDSAESEANRLPGTSVLGIPGRKGLIAAMPVHSTLPKFVSRLTATLLVAARDSRLC